MTEKQKAFLKRLSLKSSTVLVMYQPPGDEAHVGWYIEVPFSKEDGRTVNSCFDNGWLTADGGGLFRISPEGKKALADVDTETDC